MLAGGGDGEESEEEMSGTKDHLEATRKLAKAIRECNKQREAYLASDGASPDEYSRADEAMCEALDADALDAVADEVALNRRKVEWMKVVVDGLTHGQIRLAWEQGQNTIYAKGQYEHQIIPEWFEDITDGYEHLDALKEAMK